MAITGVVLAAGAGTRMGAPKAELVVAGRRLVDRARDTLIAGGCEPVLAVVRAGVVAENAVINPDPARGLRSSLAVGIEAAGHPEAIAVLLADLPGVTATGVSAVLAAWRPGRIVLAGYSGTAGHPIVMSPELWHEALALADQDEGARALLRARPDLVEVVPVDGDPADLDTPDDLARWTPTAPGA